MHGIANDNLPYTSADCKCVIESYDIQSTTTTLQLQQRVYVV